MWGEQLGRHLARQGSTDLGHTSQHHWHPTLEAENQPSHMVIQILTQMGRSHSTTLPTITSSAFSTFSPGSNSILALALLPIALFYHDDPRRQRDAIAQVFDTLSVDKVGQLWSRLYAYTLAQAVKGQLEPSTFVAQALAYLRITEPDESAALIAVTEQLQWLKVCQTNAASSSNVLLGLSTETPTTTILPLALACFLQTPTSAQLAMTRSLQLANLHLENFPSESREMQALSVLVGTFVGAYNGSVGLPIAWMVQMSGQNQELTRVQPLATQLYAAWCGLYDASTAIAPELMAVTAPWAVRSS